MTESPGNDIGREARFLLGHPGFTHGRQNRSLLRYLAGCSCAAGPTQMDIAISVLGLTEFHPNHDAHVRIAVGRLRKALAEFYQAHGTFRPSRLAIPRGRYRLLLERPPEIERTIRHGCAEVPTVAWFVSSRGGEAAEFLATTFAEVASRMIAGSALVHDGALRVQHNPAGSVEAALSQARRTHVPIVAEAVVTCTQTDVDLRPSVDLRLWDVSDRRMFLEVPIRAARAPDPFEDLVWRTCLHLVDPLLGRIPDILSRVFPRSRLAVVMQFFRFMATQKRSLLPGALQDLTDIEETHLASPLTRALKTDAVRANFCFATSSLPELTDCHTDEAAAVLESDPLQPYAWLAHAYMQAAVCGTSGDSVALTLPSSIQWCGSVASDLILFRELNRLDDSDGANWKQDELGHPAPMLTSTTRFLTAVRNEEMDVAARTVFGNEMPNNIWKRSFQCFVAKELGGHQRAREAFARFVAEEPEAEDFIGRAITRMMPDPEIHGRLLKHLSESR